MIDKYEKLGKQVRLTHLSPDCQAILVRSDAHLQQVIVTDINDPRYHVMTDLDTTEIA